MLPRSRHVCLESCYNDRIFFFSIQVEWANERQSKGKGPFDPSHQLQFFIVGHDLTRKGCWKRRWQGRDGHWGAGKKKKRVRESFFRLFSLVGGVIVTCQSQKKYAKKYAWQHLRSPCKVVNFLSGFPCRRSFGMLFFSSKIRTGAMHGRAVWALRRLIEIVKNPLKLYEPKTASFRLASTWRRSGPLGPWGLGMSVARYDWCMYGIYWKNTLQFVLICHLVLHCTQRLASTSKYGDSCYTWKTGRHRALHGTHGAGASINCRA